MIPFQLHRRIKRPFYQRDLAKLERDRAVSERDHAIAERDHAVAERAQLSAHPVVLNAPCLSPPSQQNAIDLFKGGWLAAMPTDDLSAGKMGLFYDDRVGWVANLVGGLAGKAILDLGPLEGHNAYQFEALGAASVISIEHMPVNFLKCLIVKNIFNLHTTFLLGDFLDYLEHTDKRFDLCWASGVLYHMTDPLRLLKVTARVSDRLFIWSCFYDRDVLSRRPDLEPHFGPSLDRVVTFGGRQMTLHWHRYVSEQELKQAGSFAGGNEAFSFWMEYPDIRFALEHLGFTHIIDGPDDRNNPLGGAVRYLLASRAEHGQS